jgi:hypothetical protein
MIKGRVVYIDEDPDDIIMFHDFTDDHFDLETIQVLNGDTIDEVVDHIMGSSPDAIITDFLLNEKAMVGFNGQALIECVQARNRHIPCFLLTSHAPDALLVTHDARLVQSKSIPFGGNDYSELKSLFRSQISKVIDNYRDDYEQSASELHDLLLLSPEELTAVQRQRILGLDEHVESFGLSTSILPKELKDDKSIELLTQLIGSVDELIKGRKA